MSEKKEALVYFLLELRKRLLYGVMAFALIFILLLYFTNSLYTLLALPLLKHLPQGHGLIATNIVSAFFVPFEFTSIVALFISVPVFLYQLWAFIAPALYRHERRLVWPLLFISTSLFYLGVAFAYFIIFPIVLSFLIHSAPVGVNIMPDIAQYLDFSLKLFFAFGVIFEVPVITVLLICTGVTTSEKLIQWRPYVIVGAFIIGMLLTPPDVVSQTLLAVPLWLLFEIGIFIAPFFVRQVVKENKHV
jgi:sec-independent protein translocase protein TatC